MFAIIRFELALWNLLKTDHTMEKSSSLLARDRIARHFACPI